MSRETNAVNAVEAANMIVKAEFAEQLDFQMLQASKE